MRAVETVERCRGRIALHRECSGWVHILSALSMSVAGTGMHRASRRGVGDISRVVVCVHACALWAPVARLYVGVKREPRRLAPLNSCL